MYYLDITLIVNGTMDAFLLAFTAYLLRRKLIWLNILFAVLLGELPIVFILLDLSSLIVVSRFLVPLAMVGVGLRVKSIREMITGLVCFSILAAVSGGIYYALSGWIGLTGGEESVFSLHDLWFLPLTALLLMGGYRLWEKMQKTNLLLDNILYDAELCFENDKKLKIKALLDTGNALKDPLTGTPVMILEERVAQEVLPDKIRQLLQSPWRESSNPWSYIWNDEEYSLHKLVFISAKGINGQTWLPGIRIGNVKITQGESIWEHPVTVALVPQVLSAESQFQGLLHPEHIQKPAGAGKEEIA